MFFFSFLVKKKTTYATQLIFKSFLRCCGPLNFNSEKNIQKYQIMQNRNRKFFCLGFNFQLQYSAQEKNNFMIYLSSLPPQDLNPNFLKIKLNFLLTPFGIFCATWSCLISLFVYAQYAQTEVCGKKKHLPSSWRGWCELNIG